MQVHDLSIRRMQSPRLVLNSASEALATSAIFNLGSLPRCVAARASAAMRALGRLRVRSCSMFVLVLAVLVITALPAAVAPAQCAGQWSVNNGVLGLPSNPAEAMVVWDPD